MDVQVPQSFNIRQKVVAMVWKLERCHPPIRPERTIDEINLDGTFRVRLEDGSFQQFTADELVPSLKYR